MGRKTRSTRARTINSPFEISSYLRILMERRAGQTIIKIGQRMLEKREITPMSCFTNKENPKQARATRSMKIFLARGFSSFSGPYNSSIKLSVIESTRKVIPKTKLPIAPN